MTSGRSLGESDRLSVPLSAAPLPTDWGEWDTEHRPTSSTQCLGSCSGSLQRGDHTGLHAHIVFDLVATGWLEKAAQVLQKNAVTYKAKLRPF